MARVKDHASTLVHDLPHIEIPEPVRALGRDAVDAATPVADSLKAEGARVATAAGERASALAQELPGVTDTVKEQAGRIAEGARTRASEFAEALPVGLHVETPKPESKDLDYEVELNTPFGIVELEFEPRAKKERKDRERREKAERKAAEKAAALAAKQTANEAAKAQKSGSLLRSLVIALVVIALVAGAIALVTWLFARPGEEDEDVPDELRAAAQEAAPQGPIARIKSRVKDAVRQGRKASREAQREQQQRYREMTESL